MFILAQDSIKKPNSVSATIAIPATESGWTKKETEARKTSFDKPQDDALRRFLPLTYVSLPVTRINDTSREDLNHPTHCDSLSAPLEVECKGKIICVSE